MRTVTLYTRPGCHLCDDARAALRRLSARHEFEIREVNIETDDALHAAYLERNRVVAALAAAWPAGIRRTANEGYTRFNRYFFAQQDKQGALVD